MDTVTKNRTFIWIIIFLILSNIAILLFFIFLSNDKRGNHSRDNKNGIALFLQKQIGFNKQQIDEYQKLKEGNMQKVKPLFEQIKAAKDTFYNFLYSNNVSDSLLNKSAAVIGERQQALDLQMFQHFKSVRSLCTAEQLPKFDSLFKKVVDRMTGGRFRRKENNSDKDK